MKKLCMTFLPEMKEDEVLRQQVANIISLPYNTVPRTIIMKEIDFLSQELLLLIYLTMIGFTFPVESVQYNTQVDQEKAWCRELILRLIKTHSPEDKKEYQYLT